MKLNEYCELVELIFAKYGWKTHNFPMVKYIDSTIDARTKEVFSITLRSIKGTEVFSLTNENRNKDLRAWVLSYLKDLSKGQEN